MREIRLDGSEGGGAAALPTPITQIWRQKVGTRCSASIPLEHIHTFSDYVTRPRQEGR